jgi:hypothetical protein
MEEAIAIADELLQAIDCLYQKKRAKNIRD